MMYFLVTVVSIVSLIIGYLARMFVESDDGVVILNEDRVEVIFKDPYEKLSKKRSVRLKMKT